MPTDTAPPAAPPAAPRVFGLLIPTSDMPLFVGISRSAFYRLKSRPDFPRPVSLAGVAPSYRRADVERFVERLKPARPRRRPAAGGGE